MEEEHEIGRQVECMKGMLEISVSDERQISYKMNEQRAGFQLGILDNLVLGQTGGILTEG